MEYTVIVTHHQELRWKAVVPALPDCDAEAPTRVEVLSQIHKRVLEIVEQSEVVRVQVPKFTPSIAATQTTPWHLFGMFRDDSTWGQLFDDLVLCDLHPRRSSSGLPQQSPVNGTESRQPLPKCGV